MMATPHSRLLFPPILHEILVFPVEPESAPAGSLQQPRSCSRRQLRPTDSELRFPDFRRCPAGLDKIRCGSAVGSGLKQEPQARFEQKGGWPLPTPASSDIRRYDQSNIRRTLNPRRRKRFSASGRRRLRHSTHPQTIPQTRPARYGHADMLRSAPKDR